MQLITGGVHGVRRQQRVTFAVLAVSVSAFALLQSLIVPVLPTIQEQYGPFETAPNTQLVTADDAYDPPPVDLGANLNVDFVYEVSE